MAKTANRLIILFGILACAPILFPKDYEDVYGIYSKSRKADSLLAQMTLDEKVGQLFMMPVYSERSTLHKKEIENLISQHHLGGVIFMQGHPTVQWKWTQDFKDTSKYPLFIAMDAEWGPSMRLDSCLQLSKQMTLGALEQNEIVEQFGKIAARQLKALGVNVSFSPVVDINSNPNNPVIHMRSFGENKYDVAKKGISYLRGLQKSGVMAVAKHFPGHGDTHIDSHKDLPTVNHSRRRLQKMELYPFKRLFENGVSSVMTAHLVTPAYQNSERLPGSLSKKMTSELLKENLGFEGLAFSDALNMKAVTKYVDEELIDISAFLAGNDILLFPRDFKESKERIKIWAEESKAHQKELDERVLKILQAKIWAQDQAKIAANQQALMDSLNGPAVEKLRQRVSENSITYLRRIRALPIKSLSDTVLIISFSKNSELGFSEKVSLYAPVKSLQINLEELPKQKSEIYNEIAKSKQAVLALHDVNPYRVQSNFGYSKDALALATELLSANPTMVLANFGTPYMLDKLGEIENSILQVYEDRSPQHEAAAEALFGAIKSKGLLPVSTAGFVFGEGDSNPKSEIFSYGENEEFHLSEKSHRSIDSIIYDAIRSEATPGCQLLVAKKGRVLVNKSYGYFTYDSVTAVQNHDLYDIASITKVASSTLLSMEMYEQGKLSLDSTLQAYIAGLDSNKRNLKLREILAHQAGLLAWIPFYKYTLDENGFCDSNYCYAPNSFFNLQVTDSLYVNRNIEDTIFSIINKTEIRDRGEYRYSDLGYFFLSEILDSLYNGDRVAALYSRFYEPLGIQRMRYNPLDYFSRAETVPTEYDNYFRHRLVHGYVHDPAAAMLGGVGGHAGLFSNANELGKLFQLFLQKGEYGGQRLLQESTLDTFTKKQFKNNRKGAGFDKPEKRPDKPGPAIKDMSAAAYGHTGFTGTAAWADPEHDLVYIFLSNRIHPTADNRKLISMNVRTKIMQVIYDDFKQNAAP